MSSPRTTEVIGILALHMQYIRIMHAVNLSLQSIKPSVAYGTLPKEYLDFQTVTVHFFPK